MAKKYVKKHVDIPQVSIDWILYYITKNKRSILSGYRAFCDYFCNGGSIPGLGTWHDVWLASGNNILPPSCPYIDKMPNKLTYYTLLRKLTKYHRRAIKTGAMSATMDYIPQIRRTRAGLKSCGVVQVDDMWHEVKVAYGRNKFAQRVVELSMIDVLTGHVVGYLMKPIRERDDGTREMLRNEWMRYFLAYLLTEIGIPKDGCLIQGEHGTASFDTDLKKLISQLTGDRVTFGAGGILSQPLGKGLYDGRPKGNPRYKGLLEQYHATIKNALGDVRGHVGGGRDHENEYVYGMDKMDNILRSVIRSREYEVPGLRLRCEMPYLDYWDYVAIIEGVYKKLDLRTWHNLSDWDKCGFMMHDHNHSRKLSPAEAWNLRANDRHTIPEHHAVAIMGESLGRLSKVNDDLTINYKDTTTNRCMHIYAKTDTGWLTRGDDVTVWVNPLVKDKAYIAYASGRYLGTAKIINTVSYDDDVAIREQLGIRSAAIASERKRLLPITRRLQQEANVCLAHNVREITGRDPMAEIQAQRAEAAKLKAIPEIDAGEWIPEEEIDSSDIQFDDMI